MSLHIATPLLESRLLGERAGRSVWLKLDALQPTGSFKIRGIGAACETYRSRGARRFVSSSGGNAGIAVAHAGRRLAVPVTVVVPETTSARARELITLEGATVVVQGASWHEANAHAQSLIGPDDAFLHPFDDPLLWTGHATLIDEVVAAGVRPDAVVVSVGGGGLLAGIVEGLVRNGCSDVPVIAVETEGADSLARSLAAGHAVTLAAITSIATSLGARRVCDRALACAREHRVRSVVVPDTAAVEACVAFLDDHRLVVEPACGAALAIAYASDDVLADYRNVLVVVCGGATATVEQLQRWHRQGAGTTAAPQ